VSSATTSSSVVFDASAAIDALLLQPGSGEWVAEQIAGRTRLAAPHLIDLEVISALRGLALSGSLTEPRGADAIGDFLRMRIRRYRAGWFLGRIWELRHGLTAYDAAYVALAETLEIPLVTTDVRLARAKGHRAEILAYGT
jgi:predicted nucleic acid-binding protein